MRIEVDGHMFEVSSPTDQPGQYDYSWISGPNAGYGFSSSSGQGNTQGLTDHEQAIRDFLSAVDPVTGYIEP